MHRRDLLRLAGLSVVLHACDRVAPDRDAAPPPTPGTPTSGTPGTTSPAPSRAPEPEEPAPPPARVEVLCREAWGAVPAGDGAARHTLTGLMLHHTAVALEDDREAPARWRRHQAVHRDAGWPDVAYHLGVDRQGHAYQLRDPATAGDTYTDYDPTGWLLVVAEGDYEVQVPTPAQLETIARLFAWGAATHDVPPATLTGHRDHVPTSACPGAHLYAHLADGSLRRRVETLAARGVELVSVCGDEAAARVAAIEAGQA